MWDGAATGPGWWSAWSVGPTPVWRRLMMESCGRLITWPRAIPSGGSSGTGRTASPAGLGLPGRTAARGAQRSEHRRDGRPPAGPAPSRPKRNTPWGVDAGPAEVENHSHVIWADRRTRAARTEVLRLGGGGVRWTQRTEWESI